MALTIDKLSGSVHASYDNVKETFPVSVASAGAGADTVDVTERDVWGTGTAFTTDFKKGDFVWFTTTDELRRIENIVDDEKMTLEHPVASPLSGVVFKVVPREGYSSVSWLNDSTGTIEINGIPMPVDASDTFRTDLRFIPVLIDSTVSANIVTLTAKNW